MLIIRLQRVGRKKVPAFRVVLVDHKRGPKTGAVKEVLGSYNPQFDTVALEKDRVSHWMKMGAQVSDTVHNILVSQKVIEGKKKNVLPRSTPPQKEEAAAPEAAAPAETSAEAPAAAEEAIEKKKKETPSTA